MPEQPDLEAINRIFGVKPKDEAPQALDDPEEIVVIITTNHSPGFAILRTLTATYKTNPAQILMFVARGIYQQTGIGLTDSQGDWPGDKPPGV